MIETNLFFLFYNNTCLKIAVHHFYLANSLLLKSLGAHTFNIRQSHVHDFLNSVT